MFRLLIVILLFVTSVSAQINWDASQVTITTEAELRELATRVNRGSSFIGKTITLGNDIYIKDGRWVPIGTEASGRENHFQGTFNGNGNVISGVNINSNRNESQGLFGIVGNSGLIENLGVEVNINGVFAVGGLSGLNNGTIANCYVHGNVSGTNVIGGLAGFNQGGIANCYVSGTVSGRQHVGGLVGVNIGTIENCHAIGNIAIVAIDGGGIVPNIFKTGGLVGVHDDGGKANSASGMRNAAQMQQQSTFRGWDFVRVWVMEPNINNGFPYLRSRGNAFAEASHSSENVTKGTFTDSRDGRSYTTVRIGNRTWMTENLNFEISNSSCYGNNASNCSKYGRLYTFNVATRACPTGWRLPNDNDWENLVQVAGGSVLAGRILKSQSEWLNNGNGTNEFGFSALPGGYHVAEDRRFSSIGEIGHWWSATRDRRGQGHHWGIYSRHTRTEFNCGSPNSNDSYSVRCVQE